MSIVVVCSRCDDELEETGAILFGPPDIQGFSHKDHLCQSCYVATQAFIGYLHRSDEPRPISKFLHRVIDAIADNPPFAIPGFPSKEDDR